MQMSKRHPQKDMMNKSMMNKSKLIGWIAAAGLTFGTALGLEPGAEAPAFTLPDTAGKEVSLADFKGKVVVLEWFNYGCPFVKKHYASGNLPALQKKYSDKDVVWLSINSSAEGKQGYLPGPELAEASAKEGNAATAILLDTDGKVGKAYGAKVTPHMYVICKDGKLAYMGAIDDKPTTQQSDIEGAKNYVVAAVDALLSGGRIEVSMAKPYGCGVKY